MDTTSVGTADSVEGTGETPIFDELVGRYGLTLPAEAVVPAQAGNAAVADERVKAAS